MEAGQHGIGTSSEKNGGGAQKKGAGKGKLPPQAPEGAKAGGGTMALAVQKDIGAPQTPQISQVGVEGGRQGGGTASAQKERRPLGSRMDVGSSPGMDNVAPKDAGTHSHSAEMAEKAEALILRAASESESEPEDDVEPPGPSDKSKDTVDLPARNKTSRGKTSPRSRVQKKGAAHGSRSETVGGPEQTVDGEANQAGASLADKQPMGNGVGSAGPSGRGLDDQAMAQGVSGGNQSLGRKVSPTGEKAKGGGKAKRRNRELESLLSDLAPNSLDSGPRCRIPVG